jgi:hypothetical protein
MRTFLSLVFLLTFWITFSARPNSLTQSPPISPDSTALKIYQQQQVLNFDPTQTAAIQNLIFEKEHAKFTFKIGMLYFSKPVAGKITGAVFLGEGVFEFAPPNEIERYQVRRFLEKDSLRENFSAAYLRFTDDTAETLLSKLTVQPSFIPKEVVKMHENISKSFLNDLGFNLASRIAADLLNEPKERCFYAVLQNVDASVILPNYFIYSFDPHDREEIAVYQFYPNRAHKPFYTICSFPLRAGLVDQDSLAAISQNKDLIDIRHYKMNVKLEKNGEVQIAAEIVFVPRRANLRFIDFDLFHELKVDSLKNDRGAPLLSIREKKQTSLAAIFPEPLPPREQTLVVYYSGKLMEPVGSQLFLKDKINWFPRHGYLKPATFDITFDHSKGWQVVSVGRLLDQQASKNRLASRWVQEAPSLAAAFAFGSYDCAAIETGIIVHSTPARSKKRREEVGRTVAQSLRFFEERLQTEISTHLNVVESPGLFSQSYPGLMLLSAVSFQKKVAGANENHAGHEVSHQWWGNVVGWQTYHDQWLSESLAEYSGALLAQQLVEDEKIFFEILEGWRNDLLHKGHIGVSLGLRRFGFSKNDLLKSQGMAAGPIWLGQRLGSKFPVDYYVIVYEKGAYVLHMLRTLLRDFESGSDDRFWAMLADFVATYRGRRATTFDFKRIVEKHVGEPMDWFFDQWIFGVAVPTYIYSYTISNSHQQYWLDVSLRQENVAADFKMFIPVGIQLAEKKVTQLIWMQGSEQSFRLGPFVEKPSKIIFNDFGGVLARVKQK